MGEFNSDDHYICNCGQESLRRNGVAVRVNRRVWNAVTACNLKETEWSLFISKANHSILGWSKSVPQPVCWRSWSWTVLWRPTRPSRTNTQKRCTFHHRGLECKRRKSRNTWSNRQIWPRSREWRMAKGKRVSPRGHTGHRKHPLPTTQEKTLHRDITRCPNQYQNQMDYLPCSQRWRSSIQLAKTRLETDYGSEHELLIAKYRLELRK